MDFPKSMPDIGLVNGQFVDEDITLGQVGTYIPSSWGNAVTQEIINVIESAEINPREGQNNQLALAIEQLITDNLAGAATEDKSGIAKIATQTQVDTGADDSTIVTPKKLAEKASVGIKGSYSNLRISTTGISSVITITADRLVVEGPNLTMCTLSDISLSCNLSVSGVGGLDTDSVLASAWYYIHVIYNPLSRVVASIASLSREAPLLPAGFSFNGVVKTVRTDDTANRFPLAFISSGSSTQYTPRLGSNTLRFPLAATGAAIGSFAAGGLVPLKLSNIVPPTAKAVTLLLVSIGANMSIALAPSNNFGAADNAPSPPITTDVATGGTQGAFTIMLESLIVYYAANSTYSINVIGWEDSL